MEFERITFRIYKHCLDSCRDYGGAQSSKSCWVLALAMFTLGSFTLSCLIVLHSQFVVSPGCLRESLLNLPGVSKSMNISTILPVDKILNMTVYPGRAGLSQLNYQFSYDAAILALPQNVQINHGFQEINTIMKTSCFGSETTQHLLAETSFDTVVMNFLMFTVRKGGIMQTPDDDYFTWTDADIKPYSTPPQWSNWKFNILINSLLSFFLTSSICAMAIRAYLTSIVFALYPLYWMTGLSDEVYNRDHPMLGAQISIMRSHNQPVSPFIIAHITRVALYIVLLVAAQYCMSIWFYRPSGSPGHPEFFIFVLVLFFEFVSLVFIRTRLSIQVFPRVFFLLFLLFHFYYYSYPSGFHAQALAVMWYYTLAVFFYCMADFEAKACYRRVINRNHTR